MSGVKGMNSGEKSVLYIHGGTGTRLFKIWSSMRERCYRKSHMHYRDYGGRGIGICDAWNDFAVFREWALTNGYADDLSIDRIDFNGNYSPDNCRWVTMKEQQNNKRSNRLVEYRGKTYTLTQLAEKSGLNKTTLKERLNMGWCVEDAVNRPVRLRTRGWRMSSCGADLRGEPDDRDDRT